MTKQPNDDNDNNSLGKFVLGALTLGAGVGAAVYLNKKDKDRKRNREFYDALDMKSIKQLSFTPQHLLSVPKTTISQNPCQEDFLAVFDILRREKKTIISLSTTSEEENFERRILESFTVIQCIISQNFFLIASYMPVLEISFPEDYVEIREIVWVCLSMASIDNQGQKELIKNLKLISSLLEIKISDKIISGDSYEKIDYENLLRKLSGEITEHFQVELEEDDKVNKQINNDVKRTFGTPSDNIYFLHEFFSSSSSTVENTVLEEFYDQKINPTEKRRLLAIGLKLYCSNHEPYCQGMNNVLAFIIDFFTESSTLQKIKKSVNPSYTSENPENITDSEVFANSFILFFGLLRGHKLGQIYGQELNGLYYGQIIIEKILEKHSPVLFEDVNKRGITSLTWSVQWFLTLFTYTFKPGTVMKMWDGILLYGFINILKGAGAVLKITERLNIADKDELNKAISEFPKNFGLNEPLFLKMVRGYPLTYGSMEKIIEGTPEKQQSLLGATLSDLGLNGSK